MTPSCRTSASSSTTRRSPSPSQELAEANDWIRNNIKSEIFIDSFGQEEGLKVRADGDPLVVKALDLMGQAKTLADNAKKIVAERNSARATAMASQNR